MYRSYYLVFTLTIVCSLIHFDKKKIRLHVCFYGDETYPRRIDSTLAKDGMGPVFYYLKGSPHFLSINTSSGYIYLNENVVNISHTDITLMKVGRDSSRITTRLEIFLTLDPARIFNESCPKSLHFEVRQIAPVGEEIGIVKCDERTQFNGSRVKTSYKTILVSQGNHNSSDRSRYVTYNRNNNRARAPRFPKGTYIPFVLTDYGVIVVSDKLVFHNSIKDITIFNVLLINDVVNDDRHKCTRISTSVTTVVTVKQAACQTDWAYNLTKNLYLDLPSLATFYTNSASECMSNCSARKLPQCSSIVYNVLTDRCYIYNTTIGINPNKARQRIGYFYYRKDCKAEVLPIIQLRMISKKFQRSKMNKATERIGLLKELVVVIRHSNIKQRDVASAIEIFKDLLNVHEVFDYFAEFFKISTICLEMLIRVVEESDVFVLYHLLELFEIFDDLVSTANQMTDLPQNHLEISGNITTFLLVNRSETAKSTDQLILAALDGHTGVYLGKSLSSRLVGIGVLSGFEACELPESTVNRISNEGDDFRPRRHIWNSTGCVLVSSNQTHTRCVCNHLTSFAVLMQVKEFELLSLHRISLDVVTKIGCSVSIAALATSLLVLMWLRLQSDRYILLINLMIAIILAQVVFLTGIDAVTNKVVCRVVAISLHYLYLAVFTLMLAQGIHLYHKLHRAFEPDTNFSMFLFLGWGSPVAIIAISVITNLQGYGTEQRCWLSTDGPVWAFVGPALTVISINMAILVMVIRTFLGVKFNAKKTDVDKFKSSVRVTMTLLPLLGITWMFGIAAVNGSTVGFQYVFAVLNSLQGLFIFLFHVVFNEDVKNACSKYKGRVVTMLSSLTQRVVDQSTRCNRKGRGNRPKFQRRSDNCKDT